MLNPEDLLKNYLENPLNDSELKEVEANKEKLFNENAFEKELVFGTGGVREIVGHGTNRLNRFNIARLNLALLKSLKDSGKENPLIVIAYDSRNSSVPFARQTCNILKAHGANVKIFKQPTPTPMLSFAVRQLNADAGIVLTASHNPSQYNGYKVYGNDGGQIVKPLDKKIEENYAFYTYKKANEFNSLYLDTPPDPSDLIEDEIVEAYLSRLVSEPFVTEKTKSKKILYSPLHGTGGWIFPIIFNKLKFENFSVFEKEKSPDGNFPDIASPNPEEPSAFNGLINNANGADILMATDPDADRIGVAVKTNEGYRLLTGNQVAVLLFNYLIKKNREKQKIMNPFLCKTIVTTDLMDQVARANDIRISNVLTGFKNIAAVLKDDPENYLFGGEESFGYLPVNWVRDKDSISSAIAICEMAEEENLLETLEDIYGKYGYYHDHVFSIKIQGGDAERQSVLKKLENPEEFISQISSERKPVDVLDLRNENQIPKSKELQKLKKFLGKADVVKFYFEPEMTITIRPSGTEPKIKAYIAMKYAGTSQKDLSQRQKELANEGKNLQSELTRLLSL